MQEWTYEALGILGVLTYLASYALLQSGYIRGAGYQYATLNIIAATLVLISLFNSFNMASAIIQVCWIAISLAGIARFHLLNRAVRFSDTEKALLAGKLPLSPPSLARAFFDAGSWRDMVAGETLMQTGETHGILVYLASGEAEIYAEDRLIGLVGPGSFLGEMTVLYGTAATATVKVSAPSHGFQISSDALQGLIRKHPEFRVVLEGSLSRDTAEKLAATTQKLAQASANLG